jgi:Putative GTPase activating protein for Arf
VTQSCVFPFDEGDDLRRNKCLWQSVGRPLTLKTSTMQPYLQAQLLKQVDQIRKRETNKTCADCGQRDSSWASIIHPPVSGEALGIFCCSKCYKYHSALGSSICVVKSLGTPTECKSQGRWHLRSKYWKEGILWNNLFNFLLDTIN